jgi:hypothetical protein
MKQFHAIEKCVGFCSDRNSECLGLQKALLSLVFDGFFSRFFSVLRRQHRSLNEIYFLYDSRFETAALFFHNFDEFL